MTKEEKINKILEMFKEILLMNDDEFTNETYIKIKLTLRMTKEIAKMSDELENGNEESKSEGILKDIENIMEEL